MGYRTDATNKDTKLHETSYNRDIERAKIARDNQLKDTDPMIEKEGFLGVDDIDRMRRRKIR